MAGTQLLVANFIANCENDPNFLTDATADAFNDALATMDSELQTQGAELTAQVAAITDLTADETAYINENNDYYNNVLAEFNNNILSSVAEWVG